MKPGGGNRNKDKMAKNDPAAPLDDYYIIQQVPKNLKNFDSKMQQLANIRGPQYKTLFKQ